MNLQRKFFNSYPGLIQATAKYLLIFLVLFLPKSLSIGQSVPRIPVIIDTDCGADDLRAFCLLTALHEIDILAVTTSDGALNPQDGYEKVYRLLQATEHANVPVGIGPNSKLKAPAWRNYCKSLNWELRAAPAPIPQNKIKASDLIVKCLSSNSEPVTLLCLGPLTNLADAVKSHPELIQKISRIIWYNETLSPLSGINYERDQSSADFLLKKDIKFEFISNINAPLARYDKVLSDNMGTIENKYAHIAENTIFHADHPQTIADELIPVYLWYPEFFDMQIDMLNPLHSIVKNLNFDGIREKIPLILAQKYVVEKNITFESFPDQPELYKYDVRQYMNKIIQNFGKEEWRVCVLTNEIHGHLGVYSIVGAKMGLKARELLNTDVDRLEVLSFAGHKPPMGCMNDGLQVSTGATLGLGMIHISDDSIIRPEAIFTYKGKKIRLRLKDEYNKQVDADINKGILEYGNLTDGYWKLIRILSLKYWAEWNRNDMFIVEPLN
ncbi:MAG: nucleoside hydrolase [Bacteroidota bacterium]|nr:nucleoside hydrolase [Bacteroidota bacterium]